MKGIIIEKRSRKSVVMDQNGRFVKTRTMKGWNEGEEVSFVSGAVKTARNLSIAAAFVLVLALGLFAVYAGNSYTVYLDVNPSIEIEVNAFNNVSSIQALNDDAEQISDLESLVGMKFGPAVNVAIQLLLDQGYLEEDGTVVLSITGKNGKLKTVEKEVAEALTGVEIETEDDEDEPLEVEAEEGEPKVKVYIGRVTEDMATAAEDLDVPIGRIVLATKAQEEGSTITYEAAAALSVQELQRIRNLAKTINKATSLVTGASEQGQENSKGHIKQIEAMMDKILREAAKIEGNLAGLDEASERYIALKAQLDFLLAQLDNMVLTADMEADEIIMGMAQYKGATPEEKARIREEIKEAKKADNDAKQEENRTRVEEKMDEVKAKVAALKAAKNKSEEEGPENAGDNAGENAGENSSDDGPGNSGNNAGKNAGSNAGGNGNGN